MEKVPENLLVSDNREHQCGIGASRKSAPVTSREHEHIF